MGRPETIPAKARGLPWFEAGGSNRFVPPGLPALAGVLAFGPGEVEVVAEVLARQAAQGLLGGGPDRRRLVSQPLEQPFDAVVVVVLLPPGLPTARLGP